MIVVRHDQQYELTLQAETLAVSGCRLPAPEAAEERARLEERVTQLRHLLETLDLMYDVFSQRRASDAWTKELGRMQKWLHARSRVGRRPLVEGRRQRNVRGQACSNESGVASRFHVGSGLFRLPVIGSFRYHRRNAGEGKANAPALLGAEFWRTNMSTPDRTTFENAYSGQAPWDIGRPQKVFIDAADRISGSILDAGCGTGENALFFAQRGHKVTGIDFLTEPIARAKRKAAERGLTATFFVMDALALKNLPEVFDSVIDSGLFHVFNDDDRRRYVSGLATVLRPGGRLFLACFSDEEPGSQGPRRVSAKEIRDAFTDGWVVESIEAARFEVRPDLKDISFSEGGPKAWFVVVQRRA